MVMRHASARAPEPGAGVQTPKLLRIPNLSARLLHLQLTHRARRALILFSYQLGSCPSSVKLGKVIHN